MQQDRRGENKALTGRKGFDRRKPYNGEAEQWKDLRFKATTWLSQVNPAFETLSLELDKSTPALAEPEQENKVGNWS